MADPPGRAPQLEASRVGPSPLNVSRPTGAPASKAPPQEPPLRSEGSGRRGTKRNKVHSSRYKVRKHGASTLAGHSEGQEDDARNLFDSGGEDEGRGGASSRRHRRRASQRPYGAMDIYWDSSSGGRKHHSKTIIGKLGMTAAGAAGRTALMEQKRKLYKDTTQQPLWGIRKLTINPIDKDDLRRFPGNGVKTTKFTLLSFLPKALWKQFHRLPNWWLVAVLILEFIPLPRFHPMSPWSTFLPLILTLGLCLLKDLLLDLQRRETDRWCNFRVCTIIDGRRPQLRLVHWESLRVGNIVRLTDNEEVPADVVVLATSNPEGIAHVETSKLDGETTLKFKQGVKETRTETYPLAIAGIRGRVVCEKPTSSMDQFTGSLKLDAHPRATSLDLSNFIHRGSHIRNTEWVYGVVVYTGHDTRSLRSAKHPSLKFAHIESEVNSYTLVSFFIIALLILISVMSKSSVQDRERVNNVRTEFPSSISFMLGTTEAFQNPWLAILRYMALFLAVTPVSLPFVLDCAYCIQAWLIQGDAAMTVGAPQQALGSTFAFGFGLPPANTYVTGLGASPVGPPNDLCASNESLGGETAVDGQRDKPACAKSSEKAGNKQAANTEREEFNHTSISTPSSPTMRSFAQAKGDNTWPAVHTPNIIPDLGQVDFVFIDKTGTLTGNDMTFSMCSVVGRIYGMADFQGAWQSQDYKTHSELLDAAMVEQLQVARADSRTSSRRHSTRGGLLASGHASHGRSLAAGCHRVSAQEGPGGEGPLNMAFSSVITHGRNFLGSSSFSSPAASSPPASDFPDATSSSSPDVSSSMSLRGDSGPLDCIRSLEDNSPRGRRRAARDRQAGPRESPDSPPSSALFAALVMKVSHAFARPSPGCAGRVKRKAASLASCFRFVRIELSLLQSPVQVDDMLRAASPRQAKKSIAFAVDSVDSGKEEVERVGTASSSESSNFRALNESPREAPREEVHSDDSLGSMNKKDEKLRVPFLYDNIIPPSYFRDTPQDGQIRRNCDFYDMQIFEDLSNLDERSHRVNEFLKCMALCNTVVPHFKGGAGGVEAFLPASLVQSWVATSGGPNNCALVRSMGNSAPMPMMGQRSNPRASAVTLRDAAAKAGDERAGGPPAGGFWQYPSNPYVSNTAHRSSSLEANGVVEAAAVPQPEQAELPRGDSCDSNPSPEMIRKAAKRRKSLGRGVSFKDTHEEYSFLKDNDEALGDTSSRSFAALGGTSKASGDLAVLGSSNSPKYAFSAFSPAASSPLQSSSRVSTWDASRMLRLIKYQASSPDEECLVSAASHMGYSLASRGPSSVVLQINGQFRSWQVIGVNEFTSKRGRMSIVLRPEGWSEGAVMYAKGADASMLPLLSSFEGMLQEGNFATQYEGGPELSGDASAYAKNSPRESQGLCSRPFGRGSERGASRPEEVSRVGQSDTLTSDTFHEAYHNLYKYSNERGASFKAGQAPSKSHSDSDVTLVEQHLKVFSLQGLRTMVLACKYMSQEETDAYQRLYNDAYASVYSREGRLEQVAEQFERDLEYLGITGVRDKLQAYVPETLELMMEAGIRVWIATGDDVEYTLHICHSCRLLTSQTKVFHAALATRGKRAKREGMLLYEMFREARILKRADEHICLVVTGSNLAAFLNHPDLQTCFLNMACCCDVVVAARVTPTQKADMVRLVKKRLTPQPITLAIGDGGNDVPMLQEASVGVAIRTVRGTSVAGFADFAISEFRFLQRLLFVHGRLNFMRISKVILWTFFKSILLAFPVFLFQPSAFWSAIELFDPVLYMVANFVWTTLPVIVYSFSEQDLPEHLLPAIPVLYTLGRRRLYFNGFTFSFWVVEGIIYALLTYYLLQAAWFDSTALPGGPNLGFFSFGVILLFGLVIQSNLRILMETHLWTPSFVFTTIGLSTLMYIPVVFLYSAIGWPSRGMYGIAPGIFSWPLLYFVVLLWIGVGLMLQVLLAGFKASLFPNIATSVKQWLGQRQLEHDRRRRITALPFDEPRLRLLPGGHDEYGPYCGRRSVLSAIKRFLWICGLGTCLPAPGPVHQLVDRRILAFLRDKFNPLRHSDMSSKLPPPRRFRVNENFVTYGREKKDKNLGSLDKDVAGPPGRGGGPDDVSMDSNSSGMSFDADKGRDQVKLVKVSHLINRFSLKFKDMQLEADYQIHQKKSFVKRLVPWYRVIFVFLGLYRIVTFLAEYFIDQYWGTGDHVFGWMCVPTVIVVLGLICATLSTFSHFFMDHFSVVLSSVVFLLLAEHVTLYAAVRMDGILSSVLFPVFTFVILRISFLQAVMWNILFVAAFTVRYMIGESFNYLSLSDLYDHLPLFLGSIVFVGFVGYRMEYNQRKSFLLDYSVEASRRKQREILNTMLPPFVVDQMINASLNEDGIPTSLEAEDRGTVSVVFCDVYEFQQVVASIEPTRLVEVLDSLFLCFDKSAEQFGCTKIETVFETYLAAAGLQPGKGGESDTSQTDAGDAMDMALAMLEVAAQIRYEVTRDLTATVVNADDEQLSPAARMSSSGMMRQKTATLRTVLSSRPQRIRVKIGINSGNGVVGAKKPQYALFGDTVNTASRMKTTGQPDYIHISESTYELVKEDTTLIYEPRKTQVKGKGDMNTYLLVRVLGASYPNFGEEERSLSGPVGSKEGAALQPFTQNSESKCFLVFADLQTTMADADSPPGEGLTPHVIFTNEGQHAQETPGSLALSTPSTPRLTPGATSRSSLSEALSPPGGSSPRTPSLYSLDRAPSRGQRSYSPMSSGESAAFNMTPQQLTRAYARQESVSRVLAFARDGLQTAVRESSDLKRQEIARQVHAQILREQLHHGSSSVWSSQEDMNVGIQNAPPNAAAMPQFRYAASHNADLRNSSRIGRSISTSTRQSPRATAKRTLSEAQGIDPRGSPLEVQEPRFTSQASATGCLGGKLRAANEMFNHIGIEAHAKFSVLLKALAHSSKEDEHTIDVGGDDEDTFEARESRMGVSRESLLLMKFKDKSLEARYRTHFYNNKSNINTIEQAIIIFLVTFAVQTLVRLSLPWNYTEEVDGIRYTVEVSNELYWGVRATYTCVAFFLWILFHYRNRDEVASRLEIRWMVFLLNVLFISAACVFALSNSWSVHTTRRHSSGSEPTSNPETASVVSPGVVIQTSTLGTEMLTYMRGGRTVRMPENVDLHSPVAFLGYKSHVSQGADDFGEFCPYDGCVSPTPPTTPAHDSPSAPARRLATQDNNFKPPLSIGTPNAVEIPGQRGASFWLVADSVELFFYLVILHHNTGLLFQNCIFVDILLLLTCLTFILTAAVATANTIGMVVNFPCYVFFNLVSAYWKEYIDRLTFYLNEHAKTTEGRATQLLNDMLPKQVLEEFQQDRLRLAYTHDRMTFLFADICGFTNWAKNVDACEVVTMLQKLFARFDRDSTKYKLYKLCTIGDAYVAVSEPVTEDNDDYDPVEGTSLVLTMAQSMITNIREVRERLDIPSLNMRIGLHYGTCVGGVIGSGRLRYDLWGMDVLTGNMMESNGEPGKVNVSAVLRDFLLKHFPGKFHFRFNKTVCVINRTVDSYIIHPAGEASEEDAGTAQPAVDAPGLSSPLGLGAGARREEAIKTEVRGVFSRRGSLISVQRSMARRHSVRNPVESSGPVDSPRFTLANASRPASRGSSHRSLVLQTEASHDGLNRLRREIEMSAGHLGPGAALLAFSASGKPQQGDQPSGTSADGGAEQREVAGIKRPGSSQRANNGGMRPISEEVAGPTASSGCNSDSTPLIMH
ncbi:hypothetical protein Efla_005590 [Eimeria flavescens]